MILSDRVPAVESSAGQLPLSLLPEVCRITSYNVCYTKLLRITSASSKGPSRDWLKVVKTSQAKSKIKNWLRKEYKEENIVKGRDMLEKEARRRGYDLKALFKPEWLKDIYKKFTLQSAEDIYSAVGYGGITTGQILHIV